MSKIRLYVNSELDQNSEIVLNSAQSHYLVNVMRVKKHSEIRLFNGKDGLWLGKVDIIKSKPLVKLTECVAIQECEKNLSLYFAPVKKIALHNIIRQATEMGVTS